MRVVVSEFISLDGVVQAPGAPQEDTSGGFCHGGGKTLFPNDGTIRTFKPTSAQTTATGVQVCRYQPTP